MRNSLHYDWHWIWDYGNGDLGNQGIHEMDKARWGLGKNETAQVGHQRRRPLRLRRRRRNGQHAALPLRLRRLRADLRSPRPGKRQPLSPARCGDAKKGANFVGNIFYGNKGIVVCPNYSSGVVLDKDWRGRDEVQRRRRRLTSATSSRPSAADKPKILNGDILEGHLSSTLCHLGQHQLPARR